MIDHVLIYVHNLAESKLFYEKTLSPLGFKVAFGEKDNFWSFDVGNGALFEIAQHKTAEKITPSHVAFRTMCEEKVQDFYAEALKAGAHCNGEPGPRPQYTENYYAAFVIDPNGHNIEAVFDSKP